MFVRSDGRALSGLCVLSASLLLVSGEEVWESRSGIQELRTALADLAGEGRTYLGRLAGEQTLLSVQKVRHGNNGVSKRVQQFTQEANRL